MFLFATRATEMEPVTAVVGAVDIILCRLAAVKTFADDGFLHLADRHRQAFVKNETFPVETVPSHLRVLSIGDDSPLQLGDILESLLPA